MNNEIWEENVYNLENRFQIIAKECYDLAKEVAEKHPGLPLDVLAKEIIDTWHKRKIDEDHIDLLSIKTCLQFTVRFLNKEKKIVVLM